MSDRYVGTIKCPYCKKETEYLFNAEWGGEQICGYCKKRFKMSLEFIATKMENKK